jgi:enoyl-CoA hydratase/carnithine racemase
MMQEFEMEPYVLTTLHSPEIARITLNRADAYNALSQEMLEAMAEAFEAVALQPGVKVVILEALGKAFCAGHDLKQMRASPSHTYYRKLFERCSQIMLQIQRLPQPVIAQVHGVATSAVCQLVSMCDLAVASSAAKFAVSGVNLGLFCATPSVALARNIARKKAMYLLLTGDFIDAEQAMEWGLVNAVVDPEALASTTLELAQKVAQKPKAALHMGKQLFYQQVEQPMDVAYGLACETMACNMMDDSALEGVQAFIDKRQPTWSLQK